MTIIAKSWLSFAALGGSVSAVTVPVVVGNQGNTFYFTHTYGDKGRVSITCEAQEGKIAYPKIDINNKKIICGYVSDEKEITQEVSASFGKPNFLNCSKDENYPNYRKCFANKLEKTDSNEITYTLK
ncbi:hypothetical protein MHLP_01825 [Candidatus Mycoplasma haematolamae str. Purdue]|uniref:Uncharacterized protein n=1 Tax=Mycoplasma haematolamae (strain Purdue) TaxID=1212765 RepID=I7B9M2_MYCHA|nr:hypothetical protein [Candidatus Mycoplasma haematolamae]AFO51945.1 hypothetical protein MHLP_01825 [Candidatus Mycoplasma haematolamae str. Purdue]